MVWREYFYNNLCYEVVIKCFTNTKYKHHHLEMMN
jgi:hypothetical protein